MNQQLREVDKAIENMLRAIEAGIITDSTKKRLDELEVQNVRPKMLYLWQN